MAWVRRALIVALLSSVASCSDGVAPDLERIRVAVRVSEPELTPGDTIELRVVASNPTDRVLSLRTNSCDLVVRVQTRSGYVVFQEPYFCDDVEMLSTLMPGDSLEETFRFDGTTTWGPFLDQTGSEPRLVLEPGMYQVVGGISVGFDRPSEPVDLRINRVGG